MRPIRLDALSPEQLCQLDELYHHTRDVRTRAQMILLAAEKGLVVAQIATIVRQDEETVRRWFAGARPALLPLDRGTPRGPLGGVDWGAPERTECLPPAARGRDAAESATAHHH